MVAPQSATAWRSVKRSFADDAVAQALVGHAAFVGGLGGGGEPAFVNAAAVGAVGVGVVGVELDAQAGLEEGARDPVGREAQQAAGVLQGGFDEGLTFLVTVLSEVTVFIGLGLNELDGLKRSNELHGYIRYICESAFIRCRGQRLQICAGVASVR